MIPIAKLVGNLNEDHLGLLIALTHTRDKKVDDGITGELVEPKTNGRDGSNS